ncbi:MAG: long-chain fatty acid--CoA ligase [Deltaproteobacteria bacterium]|nr:long-chain fatty acid--CoA ligase [Deltaproteobacteria bacterium]MCL5792711.1 long-chain fatty acid--CoA ligase [Deltaproteobacteria bacterium]
MDYRSIPEMYYKQADRNKGRVIIKHKKDGKWFDITWDQNRELTEALACGLIKLGIKPQEKVCILSENRNEWYVSDIAIQSAGAVTVPVYATNTPDQVAYIVNDSDAVAIIISTAQQYNKIKTKRNEMPNLKYVISMDKLNNENGIMWFYDVTASGRSNELKDGLDKILNAINPQDLATIIYTSGTTGDPKGVMLTQGNLLSITDASYDAFKDELTDEVMLSFLPLSHGYARIADFYVPLYHAKGIQAIAESIDKIADNLKEIHPTMFVSVPRVYEKVYGRIISQVEADKPIKKKIFYWAISVGRKAAPYLMESKSLPLSLAFQYQFANILVFKKIKQAVGGRLKFAIAGGAPLSKELGEFFFALGIKIIEGYGLTETSAIFMANPPKKIKFGTVGKPFKGYELRIASDGEILLKGSNVMKGYYKKPEATKEILDKDGWLYSGDIGFVDSEGYLHITDRKKDLIVTAGGKNIAPQPIENKLKMNKYIDEAVMIGDKRPYCVALIVPSFEMLEDAAKKEGIAYNDKEDLIGKPRINELISAAIEDVNKGLARFETIKKFILIPQLFSQESGELTPTIKVKRSAVEKKYKDVIEELYRA